MDKRDHTLRITGGLIFHKELEMIVVANEVDIEAKFEEREAKLVEQMKAGNEVKLKKHEVKLEEWIPTSKCSFVTSWLLTVS